jgi:hypothetical protein
VFATIAPPGSSEVPLTIGSTAFGVTVNGTVAAWSPRETHRIKLDDLGPPHAQP